MLHSQDVLPHAMANLETILIDFKPNLAICTMGQIENKTDYFRPNLATHILRFT